MRYYEIFKQRYSNMLKGYCDAELVKAVSEIEMIIDSDITNAFPMIDELMIIYDIVRDECVSRLCAQVHK